MRRHSCAAFVGGLSLLLGLAPLARGQVQVTLNPIKDNTLYQSATGALSNGAGQFFFAGMTATSSIRRGLIAFNVAGSVPAGSTITGVSLTLHLSRTASAAGPRAVELHRALVNWGEGTSDATGDEGQGAPATTGDATWLHTFFNTTSWAAQGGDFAGTASASATVDAVGFYTWASTPTLVADAQSWLDAPAGNFGWVVLGSEQNASTAKRFDGRQHVDPNVRPVLTIAYTAPVAVTDTPGTPGFALAQNAPNPFNPRTVVSWRLPVESRLSVAIFDLRGRRVATLAEGTRPAGAGSATWDGNDDAGRPAPSGSYVYRLEAVGLQTPSSVYHQTRLMTLAR